MADQQEDVMAAHDNCSMTDQVTLSGIDATIYEAIATLELIGRPTTGQAHRDRGAPAVTRQD